MSVVNLGVVSSTVSPENVRPKTHGTAEKHFRPDIEGLRGIAVLLVVLFHFGLPYLRGGFIGVDIFFVLSGYLITGLIFNEIRRSGQLSFSSFYARRVRRLLPAAALVLICTLLVSSKVYSPLEAKIQVESAVATSLYMSNGLFLHWASNYFAPETAGNPFLHTWSLAVEEQFYLVWPGLIALLCLKSVSKKRLVLGLGTVTAVSFAACVWVTFRNEQWAFFASPLRAWEFAVGGLAVLIDPQWLRRHARLLLPLSVLGLLMVIGSAITFQDQRGFPGAIAAIPVVGTALILMAGAAGQNMGIGRLLSVPPLLLFGRLSYSWYLWHWPILVIGTARFPSLGGGGRCLLALLSLLLSYATFRLVENPIRYNKKLVSMPQLSLSLAGLVPIAVIGISVLISLKATRDSQAPEQRVLLKAANDHNPHGDECLAPIGSRQVIECRYGDIGAKETVVLFGDSHADHWFVAMNDIALRHHWRLVTLVKASCPAADVRAFYNETLRGVEPECAAWREEAFQRLQALKPVAVVLSNSAGYLQASSLPRSSGLVLTPEDWRDGLHLMLSNIAAIHSVPIVLSDVPRADTNVPYCLSRARQQGRPDADCDTLRSKAVSTEAKSAELQATNSVPSAHLIDLADRFCGAAACPAILSGTVMYRDTNHITTGAAKMMEPALDEKLTAILPASSAQQSGTAPDRL